MSSPGGPWPGFGPFWAYFKPKSAHLGIWAISGGPVSEFGPFRGSWAYFDPKSVHLGDLGLDLGHFEGSLWPGFGPVLGLF